jgi:predicted nuclease of predicted toxin-antitoxin system
MLILLDENLLNKKLKQPFLERGYRVFNVYDLGWQGLKDKEILERASSYPFNIFITADKNLPYQQNLSKYSIQVIILNTRTTRPSYLVPLMEKISDKLSSSLVSLSFFFNDLGEIQQIN